MSPGSEDFAELAADLRQAAARELRWEAEDIESDAERSRLRKRDLAVVAHEVMSAGHTVTVSWRDTSVTGHVVYAKGDLAVIETGHAAASVNLSGPAVWKLVTEASHGGVDTSLGGSATFKARLAEFEQTGELVVVVSVHSDEIIEGRVAVAAVDHIVVESARGTIWFVPHGAIVMALQPVTPGRR